MTESEDYEEEYIDVRNSTLIEWCQIGIPYEYDCLRMGSARVSVNDAQVGTISFVLINRDEIKSTFGLNVWEPCDAYSAELDQLASLYLKPDGALKGALKKKCQQMADVGTIMYIEKFNLGKEYGRCADEDKVHVATEALQLLVDSEAMANCPVTLVMYIPDGRVNDFGPFDRYLQQMDARPFQLAGFQSIRTKNFPLMFRQV